MSKKIISFKANQMLHSKFNWMAIVCMILLNFEGLDLMAHGTVTSPPSRVWNCYQENPESPDSQPCIDAVASHGTQPLYDWNAINQSNANGNHMNVIPDGNLASGGNPIIYGGMDQVRSDWVTTDVNAGPYTVTWTNSAPHATLYYDVYITKSNWLPTQPLTWSNLTLLVRTPPSSAASTVDIPVTLPARTGHHVIYSVWQRSDSPEAFYSTSDVDFGSGGGGGTPFQPLLSSIDGDLEVLYSMNIKDDLTVDSTMTIRSQIISATDPELTFQSESTNEYRMSYLSAMGKFVLEEIGVGVALEIKDGDIYFPQYASGIEKNLWIDGAGKLIDKPKPLHKLSKYNFSLIDSLIGYNVTKQGVQFDDNTTLNGIDAFLLDNDNTIGNDFENAVFVNLLRQSKTMNAAAPELIYQILGANTTTDVYAPFSNNTIITPGSNIIDNNSHYYYLEVYYCNDCDFSEITILE